MNFKIPPWRLLTSPLRRFPDFIIPGEAKCGTSSLYHYLVQHPQIHTADIKEPNNFRDYGGSPHFCKMHYGWRWEGGLTGEASPEYFAQEYVPAIIADALSAPKIILIFRNPVMRTYSDHQMFYRDGRETIPFAEMVDRALHWLDQEDLIPLVNALRGVEHHPLRYINRSIYLPSLLNWKKFFPHEDILIIKSEDLFQSPQKTINQVFSFLALPPCELTDGSIRKKGNYTEMMDQETKKKLTAFFRPYNQRLYEHINMDMGWEREL